MLDYLLNICTVERLYCSHRIYFRPFIPIFVFALNSYIIHTRPDSS